MNIKQLKNFEINMPPTNTYHILLSLMDMQEVIINLFSNENSKDIISDTITATIFDDLPQF